MGNTVGATGLTGTQLVFVGTGPISLSQTTGANGGTMSIDAPATSSLQATGLVSISANGSTISVGVPTLVGASGISLSTNGSTISVYQVPVSNMEVNTNVYFSSSSSAISQATNVTVLRFIAREIASFSRVEIPMVVSLSSSGASNTAAHSISKVMILGTRSGSTINPIVGTSQTELISWASNTANFSNLTGQRLMSFPLATYVTPGEYYLAYYVSTTAFSSVGAANTTNLGGTYGILQAAAAPNTAYQGFNVASAQTSNAISFMQGVQSVSLSATNQTLQASNITQSGTAFIRAANMLIFRNQ
jgi:hypothetical protein